MDLLNSRFASLLPLPDLECNALKKPRSKDHNYFKYYGINFSQTFSGEHSVDHFFGAISCGNILAQSDGPKRWELACHLFIPEHARGSVIVVHGLFDHVGIYNHIIEFALNQQLAVFAFDLPGHGLSSGARAEIHSFSQYTSVLRQLIDQVATVLPQPWHMLAQSTGAAICMRALDEGFDGCISYVLMSPLVRPHLWNYSRFAFEVLKLFVKKRKRSFLDNSGDQNFLFFLKYQDDLQSQFLKVNWVSAMRENIQYFSRQKTLKVPLFIIQGDQDKTVDWRFNIKAIRQKFENTEVLMIDGAGHQLLNESIEIRRNWRRCLEGVWK